MEITLPTLERMLYKKSGSKNKVRQLIVSEESISLDIVKESRYYMLILHNENKICFTTRNEYIPEEIEYALITDVLPNEQRFKDEKITIKGWVRHPRLKEYSPSEVRESWKREFSYIEEGEDGPGLRSPQIAALHMILGHLKLPLDAATVVMPTGTGKTETMLATLVANRCEKLLVTVPSDSLRTQISSKFFSLGLLKEFRIVGENALYPIVGTISSKFEDKEELKHFLDQCNVVITTMSWVTAQDSEIQDILSNTVSHFFIDEAHHVKASSWNKFRNNFADEKIIQFTATPFRNDGKRLDGKIISNFPLKKAQEHGYYKNIEFISVREYDQGKADLEIARIAVERLRLDLSKSYNHILMARCATKKRAMEVFKLYEGFTDLHPVVIFSGAPGFKDTYHKIVQKQTRIIVCVDMLGEGFDLPELKIAAFHDIRKSLPVTLQLAGRFTRTKYDEKLGDASFIANIADIEVRTELADLYATDADWNEILSDASAGKVEDQIEYKEFMDGFKKINYASFPFQNIMIKLSTVVFKNKTDNWFPTNFKRGIPGFDDYDFKFFDVNSDQTMLVIVTGKRLDVAWVHDKRDIYNIQWDIIVVYWEPQNNLLFINSSDNSSLYTELARAVIGENAEIIRGIEVFKSFYNLKRIKLQNVGLKQFLGKSIRFRMMVGSDVADALSLAEKQRGQKAFVLGTGFEEGRLVNVGASYKGRIWTKLQGDLKQFRDWCIKLGNKLMDDTIDPNQILRETLIPSFITEVPDVFPVWIDWDLEIYKEVETKFNFIIGETKYNLSELELVLVDPSSGKDLLFAIKTETKEAVFKLRLFMNNKENMDYPDFEIIQQSDEKVEVCYGRRTMYGKDFFEDYVPTIWFADGSALTGNEYVQLKQQINAFPKNELIPWDWTGVDIKKEAQGVNPKLTDSIQYKVIERLQQEDVDIIYDDDSSGEIADVISIKSHPDKIEVKLYHLKFALGGVVSNQIKNFYEVCGQAQKSIHWKHKSGKEFINHLLRRETKSIKGVTCSRLEKGGKEDLVKLLGVLKNEIPVIYEIYIVQPGVSKENVSDDILTLLGVTSTFIKEFTDIDLKVITSE